MGTGASCGAPPRDIRVLLAGVEGAGKTTILYRLVLGEAVQATPTIGFNVETVKTPAVAMTIWDVGGSEKIRPLWRHYTTATQVLMYVVDCCDSDRLDSSADALHNLLANPDMDGTPIVVLVNKIDEKDAMSTDDITKKLRLDTLKSRDWHVIRTCAISGEGLDHAIGLVSKVALR